MNSKFDDMLLIDILCDKLISELYEMKSSIVSYKCSLTNLSEYAKQRELLVELFDSPTTVEIKRLKYIRMNLVSFKLFYLRFVPIQLKCQNFLSFILTSFTSISIVRTMSTNSAQFF